MTATEHRGPILQRETDMAIKSTWTNRKEAKLNGWYSRRHRDSAAHMEARDRHRDERGREARQRRAWDHCRVLAETGAHNLTDGRNCKCCGCPASEATTANAA